MRLYVHLFLSENCEAHGCRIRTRQLWRQPGGIVRACCPIHARAADEHLTREGRPAPRRVRL